MNTIDELIRTAICTFFEKHPLGKVTFSVRDLPQITVCQKFATHGVLIIEGDEAELYSFLRTYQMTHSMDNFTLRFEGGYFLTTL